MDELLRLVNASLPITEFTKSKLSSRGHIISICEGSGSGMKARNSMPFRVHSDVFIAAGGRPHSMNDSNWRQYFSDSGVPSSRLILEGCSNFVSSSTTRCVVYAYAVWLLTLCWLMIIIHGRSRKMPVNACQRTASSSFETRAPPSAVSFARRMKSWLGCC